MLDKLQQENLPFLVSTCTHLSKVTLSSGWVLHIHRIMLVLQRRAWQRQDFLGGLCPSCLQSRQISSLFAAFSFKPTSVFGRYFPLLAFISGMTFFYQKRDTCCSFFLCFTVQHLPQSVTFLQLLGFAGSWEMVGLQLNNYSWLKSLLGWSLRRANNEHRARHALCERGGIPHTCTYNKDERLML